MPPFWAREGRGRYAVPLHATSVVVVEPTTEPMDVPTAKAYARITGTDLDALFPSWIKTARIKVEQDTGLALLTQTRDVYLDAFPAHVLTLPSQSAPLQSVTSVKSTDTSGVVNTFDPTNYVVDLVSQPPRIGLAVGGIWPIDLRYTQPIVIRIVSGYVDVAHIPAPLVQAVGLLCGFYANDGSDRFMKTARVDFDEYEEAIAPFRLVTVV